MEATYRKNLSGSYMCVEEQGIILQKHELHMIEGQKIPGLLHMKTVITDGRRQYLYDISGKQQVADYISGRKITYGLLKDMLFSMQAMCRKLPEYLLRENGICLEMEFIYVNLEDASLQFTYLPFYDKELPEAFELFMEQLLRNIDHQDKEAVELGYQVYQLCIQDNVNINHLLEKVMKTCSFTNAEESVQMEEAGKGSQREGRENNEKDMESGKKYSQRASHYAFGHIPKYTQQTRKGEEKSGIMKKVGKQVLSNVFHKLMPGIVEIVFRDMYKSGRWKQKVQIGKIPAQDYGLSKKVKQKQKEETKELQEQKEWIPPTEILGAHGNEPMGKLVYQGVAKCEDILIQGENFLLGKNGEQVDGIIQAEGVSRLHAKITRQDNKYFIEDLNSTNGTFLNDVALEYHQPQELCRNDKIRFGLEEYMFS